MKIMQYLRHPNIVSVRQVLMSGTNMYVVMELVTGGELYYEIVKNRRIDEKRARRYFQQLVDAMVYCHRKGVYHRDLKPENLLLDENDDIKITDFGMSWMRENTELAADNLLHTQCGTPKYMAPEVITRAKQGYRGDKIDVWDCAMVLYAMLAGYLPFGGDDDRQIFRQIVFGTIEYPQWFSEELCDLLKNMMDKNPDKRWSLEQVRAHSWFLLDYAGGAELDLTNDERARRRSSRAAERSRSRDPMGINRAVGQRGDGGGVSKDSRGARSKSRGPDGRARSKSVHRRSRSNSRPRRQRSGSGSRRRYAAHSDDDLAKHLSQKLQISPRSKDSEAGATNPASASDPNLSSISLANDDRNLSQPKRERSNRVIKFADESSDNLVPPPAVDEIKPPPPVATEIPSLSNRGSRPTTSDGEIATPKACVSTVSKDITDQNPPDERRVFEHALKPDEMTFENFIAEYRDQIRSSPDLRAPSPAVSPPSVAARLGDLIRSQQTSADESGSPASSDKGCTPTPRFSIRRPAAASSAGSNDACTTGASGDSDDPEGTISDIRADRILGKIQHSEEDLQWNSQSPSSPRKLGQEWLPTLKNILSPRSSKRTGALNSPADIALNRSSPENSGEEAVAWWSQPGGHMNLTPRSPDSDVDELFAHAKKGAKLSTTKKGMKVLVKKWKSHANT